MPDFEHLPNEPYPGGLSDVIDEFGFTNQAMKPFVQPVDASLVMMRRARAELLADTHSIRDGEDPYEIGSALLDELEPGRLYESTAASG